MKSFSTRSSAAAFLLIGLAAVGPVQAEIVNAADWTESTTDASGNYPVYAAVTQVGNGVTGPIATNAIQSSPDSDVTNYIRTGSDFGAGLPSGGDSTLLGNLSGYAGLSATFSISNSTLGAGVQFTSPEIVGETVPPGAPGSPTNSAVRLVFSGGGAAFGTLTDGNPNEWWFDPSPAVVTSMLNGVDVTLNSVFDPSLWSNYDGIVGNASPAATAQFNEALSDVTRLGLSFGSGDFFSDGFAFDTGGTATINLDAIDATSATPEPGTFGLLLAGGVILLGAARRKLSAR
jgi:hypothetical protein